MFRAASGNANTKGMQPLRARHSSIALSFLGVFHIVCLGLIMAMPEFRGISAVFRFQEDILLRWWTSLIMMNAVVAVGLTLPLSRRKPANDWRSLWLVWLYVGYLLAGALLSGVVIRQFRFAGIVVELMPFRYMPLRLNGYELPIVLSALLLMGLICGVMDSGRLRIPGAGWKMWLAVCALCFATRWNQELVLLPVALLVCLGFYVAFSALGREWFLRSLPSVLFFSTCACLIVVWYLIRDVWAPLHVPRELYKPGLLGLVEWHRARGGGSEVWTSTWLFTFVPLAMGLALPHARLKQHVPRYQLLLHLVMLIQVFALLMSFRRSAIYALILMGPVALIVTGRLDIRKVLKTAVPAVAVFVIFGLCGVIPARVFYFMTNDSGHADSIRAGFDMLRAHPLTGVGPGRFGENAVQWSADHKCDINWCPMPLNDYVWVLAETGIVGLVLWLAAGVQILLTLKRLFVREEYSRVRIVLNAIIVQIVTNACTMALLIGVFGRGGWFVPNAAFISALLGAILTDRRMSTTEIDAGVSPGRVAVITS